MIWIPEVCSCLLPHYETKWDFDLRNCHFSESVWTLSGLSPKSVLLWECTPLMLRKGVDVRPTRPSLGLAGSDAPVLPRCIRVMPGRAGQSAKTPEIAIHVVFAGQKPQCGIDYHRIFWHQDVKSCDVNSFETLSSRSEAPCVGSAFCLGSRFGNEHNTSHLSALGIS